MGAQGHSIEARGGYRTRGVGRAIGLRKLHSRKTCEILDAKSCMLVYFERHVNEKVTSRPTICSIASPNKLLGLQAFVPPGVYAYGLYG